MMGLVVFALVATGVAAAWMRARAVIRRRPESPEGLVLRAIDDQILWAGIATGVLAIASWWITRATVPWLAWSWVSVATAQLSEGAASSGLSALVVLGVVILAVYVYVPMMVLVDVSPIALMVALWGARERMFREQVLGKARPQMVRSAVIRTALFMLFGVPVVAAMECALVTIAADVILARRSRQYAAAQRHPEVVACPLLPVKMDQNSKNGKALSSLWDPLPRIEQDRCAQMAGFVVVLTTAMIFTTLLHLLFS